MTFQMPAEEMFLNFQEHNPKRKGSKAYEKYDLYKWASCASEFLEEGGTKADLKNDVERGFCVIEPPLSYCPEPAEDIAEFSKVPTPVSSDEEEEVWEEDDEILPEPELEQEDQCIECHPDAPGTFKCSLCAPTPVMECLPCAPDEEIPFSAITAVIKLSPPKAKAPKKSKSPKVKKPALKKVTPENCKCYARVWCGVRDKEYQSEYLQGEAGGADIPGWKYGCPEDRKVVYMTLPQMRCNSKSKDGDYCGRHGKEAAEPRGLRHGDIRDKPVDFLNKGHINHFLGYGVSENVEEKITGGRWTADDHDGKWEWIPEAFRNSAEIPRKVCVW